MKIAIMQPTFNPWLGYFDLIDYVDKFIFLDTVQLNQQSWQTRNKIKVQNKELMVSIPIQKNKSKSELLIRDVLMDFRKFDFRIKLFRTLEQNYKKSHYNAEVNDFIKKLVLYETKLLGQYNINIIKEISFKLNIQTEFITLSETDYKIGTSKGKLVLDICNHFGATEYISPIGSREYLEKEKGQFMDNEIEIFYQYYNHPTYQQIGDVFIPYMGIIDLLYNEGFENSSIIMKNGRKYENR